MSAYYGPTPVQRIVHKQQVWRRLERSEYDAVLADAAPLNYFGHSKAAESVSHYDCRFNSTEGWDQRRARCDRRPTSRVHSKIYDEEKRKVVPVLWSLWYGRPALPPLEPRATEFARRPQLATFYRRCGLSLQMDQEQKPA